MKPLGETHSKILNQYHQINSGGLFS